MHCLLGEQHDQHGNQSESQHTTNSPTSNGPNVGTRVFGWGRSWRRNWGWGRGGGCGWFHSYDLSCHFNWGYQRKGFIFYV